MTVEEKITLAELQRVIRDKLYESFPGFYWIIAEIAEIKVNTSGHCYLELTWSEAPGEKISARARATIWSSKYRNISAYFSAVAGIPLRAGITILFKATVEYHELYGLSLNISDIDPAYTAGDMALRREAIIRRLTEEGILEMNRELEMPLYPREIAVISSEKAAGYNDFVRHLKGNRYGYAFTITLFDAVMQGKETELSVTDALNRVAEEENKYDIVAIIRGGGSSTDLSWFDNYNIAFNVTQFPIPVLTGIGHEKDLSVTDIVAWKTLKTPTAVADFIIERTLEAETHILEMASMISSLTADIISDHNERLFSLQNHISNAARMIIRVKNDQAGYFTETLRRVYNVRLNNAKLKTDDLSRALHHLDPSSVLKRGFTLTSKEGKIIHDASQLNDGDIIVTHFEKDEVSSVVSKRTLNKKKTSKQ